MDKNTYTMRFMNTENNNCCMKLTLLENYEADSLVQAVKQIKELIRIGICDTAPNITMLESVYDNLQNDANEIASVMYGLYRPARLKITTIIDPELDRLDIIVMYLNANGEEQISTLYIKNNAKS